jgi:hypothetical protein
MREFWRTMTGPKQGVYSVRRARSAHRNASTKSFSPSDSRSYRLGGLQFGASTLRFACNGLGCLRQSRAGPNCGGLSRENNA